MALTLAGMGAPAWAEDAANAGKSVFREQCALCHSAQANDDGGAQGPDLGGVFGRKAAGTPRVFLYEAIA